MTSEMLEYYRKEKATLSKLNFEGFTDDKYEIVDVVCNSLVKVDKPVCTKDLKLDDCVEKALENTKLLKGDYTENLRDTTYIINTDSEEYDYSTAILNKYNSKRRTFSKKALKSYIVVPPKFNELSHIWLSHEYIHKLKDSTYNEFKSLYVEVLSLFYEIVVANNSDKDVHDKWKQARLSMFWYNKHICELAMEKLDRDPEICKHIIESYSKYFLCYYHAVNLYSEYKNNPQLVLKYVDKVLKNKMTTEKLLNKLDMYKLNNDNIKTYNLEQQKI